MKDFKKDRKKLQDAYNKIPLKFKCFKCFDNFEDEVGITSSPKDMKKVNKK